MKCRLKNNPEIIGHTGTQNTHSLSEVIVYFNDGADSMFIDELDVYIEARHEWVPLDVAWANKDVIPDNYNTEFREPLTYTEREIGYY